MTDRNVIATFSEDHVERLTGLSKGRLRNWHKTGFFKPAFTDSESRDIARVYSFRDLASLNVLKALRDTFGVSLQHLKKVKDKLRNLDDEGWASMTLYVLNKRVVIKPSNEEPPLEVVSNQLIFNAFPLQVVHQKMADSVRRLNERGSDEIGSVERRRRVAHNAPVIAGTRISVQAVRNFHDAGYSVDQILSEYPVLTRNDVEAAIAYEEKAA